METLVTPIRTQVVTDVIAPDSIRRRLPAPRVDSGELGRELMASALLMVAVLSSTGVVLGTLLGALWLFG